MAELLQKVPVPLVIATQAPDTIVQNPQTPEIFSPSTVAFIQSLKSVVAFIKETSHDSEYDSEYISEYDSEDNSEYDSEYGSEYGSEYDSECDSKCSKCSREEEALEQKAQSSKKKVEGIVTVSKEEGTSRKTGKKADENESKANLDVGLLIGGSKKIYSDESTQLAPSKSSKGKEPASIANDSTHDTDSLIETFRSNSLKPLDDSIHVFIDNSNILAGFMAFCKPRRRHHHKPKLNYDALFRILEDGGNVARRVLVASSPLYQSLTEANQAGYEVSILERIRQREQCVDEVIHLKILESLLDHHNPSTLVLASGDGKDAEYFQGGFYKCVIKALERGWKVKVISWRRQLSQNFLNVEFLKKWKNFYQVIYLDRFAWELGCYV